MDLFTIIGWIVAPLISFLGGVLLKVKFSSPEEKANVQSKTIEGFEKLLNAQSARIDDLEKELNEREKNHVKEIAQLKSRLGIVNEKVKSLQICREKYLNCKTDKIKAFKWIKDVLNISVRESFDDKLPLLDSEIAENIQNLKE